ncbi:hypothetical protein BKA65DRAFT_482070 [Rhexocercosporidium sp. MPI-PUGE-AT-0058]|nr:hypothetical protein BKA65DRAFT_482070 [Rhexocercosporidium sp. MPI-PUGE-AT-0058]
MALEVSSVLCLFEEVQVPLSRKLWKVSVHVFNCTIETAGVGSFLCIDHFSSLTNEQHPYHVQRTDHSNHRATRKSISATTCHSSTSKPRTPSSFPSSLVKTITKRKWDFILREFRSKGEVKNLKQSAARERWRTLKNKIVDTYVNSDSDVETKPGAKGGNSGRGGKGKDKVDKHLDTSEGSKGTTAGIGDKRDGKKSADKAKT